MEIRKEVRSSDVFGVNGDWARNFSVFKIETIPNQVMMRVAMNRIL